jgi:hypothetical protein
VVAGLFAFRVLRDARRSPAMQAFLEDEVGVHDVVRYGLNRGHRSVTTTRALGILTARRASRDCTRTRAARSSAC